MAEKLEILIKAGNPLIAIETVDEERAVELVRRVAGSLNRPLYEWSVTTGLRRLMGLNAGELLVPSGNRAAEVLAHIQAKEEAGIFLFKDVGPHCKDATVHRTLRDLLSRCEEMKSTLLFVDVLPLPEEVRRFTVRYSLAWPEAEELERVVRQTFQNIRREHWQQVVSQITRRDMEQLVQTLRGLSCTEAERVVAWAVYDDYALTPHDLPRIVEAKRTLLSSAGCLESIAVDFEPGDIGGLKNLNEWLRQRRGGFSVAAREFGLEPPRGVLMLGVPGCGKSLCAKVVAADWNMPLQRLDPGVLYQKFVGASESQLRQALAQAESMAPVVLWIDEIEKAFASASAESADGGLSKRMFGTLLSWMQDHRHPIFLIATANDISALPPELMRKGRFDEVFFIDLPTAEAREQIFGIHVRRRGRDPGNFDLGKLAAMSEGFTGSEIEQAVLSGLFVAWMERQQSGREVDLEFRHIADEIRKTRPLSVLMGERIAELRSWADGRCVLAD